jgi:hypothetical protein
LGLNHVCVVTLSLKKVYMTRFTKLSILSFTGILMAMLSVWSTSATLAQGPGPNRPSINVQTFNACTSTDYGAIAAKALGITPVELRKDIVKGQTLQEIAASKNVELQTAADAVQVARKADIEQAVKDGVMTQDEAAPLLNPPAPQGTPPASQGTRPAPGGPRPAATQQVTAQNVPFPDISNMRVLLLQMAGTEPAPGNGPRGGFGLNAGMFNLVKQYAVAAQVLNVKCADLVKTLITPPGKAISDVAAAQKVDVQTVSDALNKAYKDALAQDVSEGVITQAEADQLSPVVTRATAIFVYNPLPRDRRQPRPNNLNL